MRGRHYVLPVDENRPDAGANQAERRRWNDDCWTSVWQDREKLTTAVTPYLLGALDLRPGERVLDIGCGGGGTTIAWAEAVGPRGFVVGSDISTALIERARHRAARAGVSNLTFVEADCQTQRIEGGPFHVATSQFGVMFFDEPVRAFANIREHVIHSGRLVFACWQSVERNPWHTAATLRPFVPPPPVPEPGKNATGPFTMGDPVQTSLLLESAGFSHIRCTGHEINVDAPASAVFNASLLEFMGVRPEQMEGARRSIDGHLERFRIGADLFRYPLAFQIVKAVPGGG